MIENRKIHPHEIITIANKYNSVLEIGCSEGNNLINLQCKVKVGIEGCSELIIKNLTRYIDNNIIILDMDVFDIDIIFKENQFDCIIAIDIIEHFTKENALIVLEKCEKIAKKSVLCFIPVGNHPQFEDPRGVINPLNNHLSTWYEKDMEDLGYDVYYDYDFHHEPNKDSGAMLAYKFLGE